VLVKFYWPTPPLPLAKVGAGPLHEMSDPCGIDPLA